MPCTMERDGCLEGITGISISVTWLILLSWKASPSALVGTSMAEGRDSHHEGMRVLFFCLPHKVSCQPIRKNVPFVFNESYCGGEFYRKAESSDDTIESGYLGFCAASFNP